MQSNPFVISFFLRLTGRSSFFRKILGRSIIVDAVRSLAGSSIKTPQYLTPVPLTLFRNIRARAKRDQHHIKRTYWTRATRFHTPGTSEKSKIDFRKRYLGSLPRTGYPTKYHHDWKNRKRHTQRDLLAREFPAPSETRKFFIVISS
mmetsp:Transcript_9128/g.17198  ORF Transcript_9128/g.17198 Transcript_9128/m.17198 type:complete len:147 (+) Transcript_9128:137-577(+)